MFIKFSKGVMSLTCLLLLHGCTAHNSRKDSTLIDDKSPVKATFIEYNDLNFGKLKSSTRKYSKILVLKNKSRKNVLLNSVSAGCSCLSFNHHGNIINANDSIYIQVIYTPRNRKGYFSKMIFINLNNSRNYVIPCVYGYIE